jgi:hypothetical protein
MAESKPAQPPNVPFGTHPRRPAWPLAALIVAFSLWFAFLVWMAARYPAR